MTDDNYLDLQRIISGATSLEALNKIVPILQKLSNDPDVEQLIAAYMQRESVLNGKK